MDHADVDSSVQRVNQREPNSEGAGLTVAVTGPTGEIGRSVVRALERSRKVGRIIGMARRPFDPAEHGWKRAEYVQGDVLDRGSVEALDLVAVQNDRRGCARHERSHGREKVRNA